MTTTLKQERTGKRSRHNYLIKLAINKKNSFETIYKWFSINTVTILS